MRRGFPARRISVILRVAGFLVCSPLQAFAYVAVTGSLPYGLALTYAPLAAGAVGLASRPLFDAIRDRESPRSELSAKGAIAGMVAVFAALLAFAPHDTDRTKLAALFFAGALAYYAIGKSGCIVLGCCRAKATSKQSVSLPALEAFVSLTLGVLALASLFATSPVRSLTFIMISFAFLSLRVFSRCARGERLKVAIRRLDSIAILVVALAAMLAAIAAG